MPTSALARLKSFHSICHKRDNNIANTIIERRVEMMLSGAL
jgi:hypothetical protein